MSTYRQRHRGLAMREVLVAAACSIIILIVVMVVFNGSSIRNRRPMVERLKDATQLSMIHKSWLTFSQEFGGAYPTPGLLKRLPDPVLGVVPGRGPEDISQNTTANIFSMCIMQNYITPELCIGPTEPSSHVQALAPNSYDWSVYQPANCVYWDTNFKAGLHDVSNVSYAHQPLCGERRLKNWRTTLDAYWAVIGNRGPLNGVADPKSITNEIHPPFDRWSGNIVFADNHVEFLESFSPSGGKDNLFAWDTSGCNDVLLTFTMAINESGPVIEHD